MEQYWFCRTFDLRAYFLFLVFFFEFLNFLSNYYFLKAVLSSCFSLKCFCLFVASSLSCFFFLQLIYTWMFSSVFFSTFCSCILFSDKTLFSLDSFRFYFRFSSYSFLLFSAMFFSSFYLVFTSSILPFHLRFYFLF